MIAAWRQRVRGELEVLLGGVQMRAMQKAIARVANVTYGKTAGGIAYFARPGRRGVPLVGIHGFGGDKETWLFTAALTRRSRGMVGLAGGSTSRAGGTAQWLW